MLLVLAGMNDVINSQGYTQAAFWNRIPRAVWWLMATIALLGLAAMFGLAASTTVLTLSDAEAQTVGMERRHARRVYRRERRVVRRVVRHERRAVRRAVRHY
jgi:ABC-type Fe3+-siderophore transport system permease subunit